MERHLPENTVNERIIRRISKAFDTSVPSRGFLKNVLRKNETFVRMTMQAPYSQMFGRVIALTPS